MLFTMSRLLTIIVVAIAFFETINCAVRANEINCESFGVFGNKSCILSETLINSTHVSIAERDEKVEAIWMHNNQNAFYLPAKIAEKFPNIVLYQADRCSIKEISRGNFLGLSRLRELDLSENQIEIVKSETFAGLSNLHFLRLKNNKITKLNAKSFGKLQALEYLDLRLNACIDEDFIGHERIGNSNNYPLVCEFRKLYLQTILEADERE